MESGREYNGRYSSRRIVLAVTDIKTDEYRPSVGELTVLVSWILAGMRHQESTKIRRHKKGRKTRFQMVLPVCHLALGQLMMAFIDATDSLLFYAASPGSSTLWVL